MTLKADGSGLFNVTPDVIPEYREARIAGVTEESIFKGFELAVPGARTKELNFVIRKSTGHYPKKLEKR